jgi:hypothetical protein
MSLSLDQATYDRLRAAEEALKRQGYTYHGGELWKPPLGPAKYGRTTRMMMKAWDIASTGKKVYIVCHNHAHAKQIEKITHDWGTPQKVTVISAQETPIDWNMMRVIGSSHDSVTLIDHAALESRFDHVLTLLKNA